MKGGLEFVFELLGRWVGAIVDPLRRDPDANQFRLSIPETHTTTIDGDTGWGSRPPARVRCPQCGSDIDQRSPLDDLDCPRCVAVFDTEEFSRLELRYLYCPVCATPMEHGSRHPEAIDLPEWATCERCRYHWELGHLF